MPINATIIVTQIKLSQKATANEMKFQPPSPPTQVNPSVAFEQMDYTKKNQNGIPTPKAINNHFLAIL